MQKKPDKIKSKKYYCIYAENCNATESSALMDNIFGQRLLAYRHGIRYYRFPRKEKILPVCS